MASSEAGGGGGGGGGSAGGGSAFDAEVARLSAEHPRPAGVKLSYGTAGFRSKAEFLDSTFLRMGFLSALRAYHTGAIVGVMITASHNPVQDNGLKMVDPDGGMLAPAFEAYAGTLANVEEGAVIDELKRIIAAEGINMSGAAKVYIAKDTRPHSERLAALVDAGAKAMGAEVVDYGLLSTPQLHHLVRMANSSEPDAKRWGSEDGYYNMLVESYNAILQGVDPSPASRGKVIFDGAYGVGAPKLDMLAPKMKDLVVMEVRNRPGEGPLNDGVGAEHVQKGRVPPGGVSADDKNIRLASVDGDADRLVYHYFNDAGEWRLLDGDAIAALAAVFISEQLRALGLPIVSERPADAGASISDGIAVGVVQTAYANGASSRYIRETLGMPVPLAKTGVKFVHHKALEYDVGVYFEANGHGTVLFSSRLLDYLKGMDASSLEPAVATARARLLAASNLINQAVGDAISDALFIEAVLTIKGWSIADWDAMYDDLPSRQTKLAVADRTAIKTIPDETRLTDPADLQAAIDELVSKVASGRAFVRPSGTEDVVRVYAEAATTEEADKLALDVAQAAHRLGGGVGDAPASL